MSKCPTLTEILAYQNPKIVRRFKKDFPEKAEQAQDLFTEMLKFLWLGEKHSLDVKIRPEDESLKFKCAIHEEMVNIDHMWHTFILFTPDYSDFCQTYFGKFRHHYPTDDEDLIAIPMEQFEEELSRFSSYVYDQLGPATLQKWFSIEL